MKKAPKKLELNRETLREMVLAATDPIVKTKGTNSSCTVDGSGLTCCSVLTDC